MKILAIESSCDDTGISIIDIKQTEPAVSLTILAHEINSQESLHSNYGGVYPNLAKNEHSQNLVATLVKALKNSNLYNTSNELDFDINDTQLNDIFSKDKVLFDEFISEVPKIKKPDIDIIAFTMGPGLEPSLWTGITLAKALGHLWQIPILPVNHMAGHFWSGLVPQFNLGQNIALQEPIFPVLGLLVSGGHSDLIIAYDFDNFEIIGRTLDDAVGEAFDKVAIMLGLTYPGGKKLQDLAFTANKDYNFKLPRPMMKTADFNFSFSGIKTAVKYLLEKNSPDNAFLANTAYEFQEAVTDVLVYKTIKAIEKYHAKSVIVAGGVSANLVLREKLTSKIASDFAGLPVYFPPLPLCGDNATMIALAGYFNQKNLNPIKEKIIARGTWKISENL